MHVTGIELENIKCHAEAKFEFSRGTTAITGENGAGKTTLIEAIAWTLFDLLDYKKEDFVRRGAKKGSARVTFESGIDERRYTVYRDTGTGYYVYDPGLKLRIADKKEEVLRFLWQHLGVEAGTDLESLFRRAIGVPQGTFTAIFIESAAERKKAFDKLLKVEEYRRGAEELLKTQRFVEAQIGQIREKIARFRGELDRSEAVEADFARLKGELSIHEKEMETVHGAVAEKNEIVSRFEKNETAVLAAKTAREAAKADAERAALVLKQKEAALVESREAVAKLENVRKDADLHQQTLAELSELDGQRLRRDELRTAKGKCDSENAAAKASERHIREQLLSLEKAANEIESLTPLIAEQEKIEKEINELREKIAELKADAATAAKLDESLVKTREVYSELKVSITKASESKSLAERVPVLEKRESEITAEIAGLRANLERDLKFQAEIKNGLCPILSERCLNLKDGQTLESFVTSQFSDLRESIGGLEKKQTAVAADLTAARAAEIITARLADLERRFAEVEEEGLRLAAERKSIAEKISQGAELENDLNNAEKRLAKLNNPKSRMEFLAGELARRGRIEESLKTAETDLERIRRAEEEIDLGLAAFQDFDHRWEEAVKRRDATAASYKTFLRFTESASNFGERESAFLASKQQLSDSEKELKRREEELALAEGEYDRERHNAERAELLELQRRLAAIQAQFNAAKLRVSELEAELERFSEIKNALASELTEKERLEKVAETTIFIRDTLKEAAPLVARNYVYHVSLEANQLFREISGNAERSLKWAEDYGIYLEEGGYDRPFISLSGGEQMAAALSVRLALLKQLSDIRIAFFDEPTTNMDAERRENLAMQIGQIKHFDQLFVISHDDTFEGHLDHEIRIERQ